MKTSIIIPTYNGLDLIRQYFPSVYNTFSRISNVEIIVVDDGSSDESTKFLKNNYPLTKVIKHKINRGFSVAVNTGVRSAKGDYIVLLNNDVKVNNNFLDEIYKLFNDGNVFGVSLHEKGYGYTKGKFEDGFVVHTPVKETNSVGETFWISGGSCVFKREYFIKIGSMDEKLFPPFYWEDIDLSYRALKRGYKLLWDPKSEVEHLHGSSTSKINPRYRQRVQERNQLLFIWKNITSPDLTRKHISGLFKRIIKHPGYLIILFLALRKIFKVFKLRRKEKKDCRVSDEAIFAKF